MMRLFDHIPTACPLCRQRVRGVRLCQGCLDDLDDRERGATPHRCLGCGLRPQDARSPCWTCRDMQPPWMRVVIALPYEPPYISLMARYKQNRQIWLATCLSGLLWRARPPELMPDRLVPVPSSDASLRRRGFNPAAEIARGLGIRWRKPVSYAGLVRTRDSPKQSELGHLRRQIEAVDLFRPTASLKGERVVLVDDVMTTGATLTAATHAILDAGAHEVVVMAVARTERG